jgi:hypothetical protein
MAKPNNTINKDNTKLDIESILNVFVDVEYK